MNEIILTQTNEKVTVDSRLIAEHFEKDHRHVIRDIENIIRGLLKTEEIPVEKDLLKIEPISIEKDLPKIGPISVAQNCTDLFIPTTYPDSYGRHQRNYQLTRDGFSLLVMGFTGQKALIWKLKYIEAFNTMEKQISTVKIPTTFADALRLAADQAEIIEKQKPLIAFAETCAKSETSILIRELAKIASKNGIEIGERRLFQKLRDWKLIFGHDNEPYQTYVERGFFEISQGCHENDKGTFMHKTTRVLPKGQQYIINRLRSELSEAG